MSARRWGLTVTFLVVQSACTSADHAEGPELGRGRQAVEVAVPCTWAGTRAELAFADAMAGCEAITDYTQSFPPVVPDNWVEEFDEYVWSTASWYARGVLSEMALALGEARGEEVDDDDAIAYWRLDRPDPSFNCSAETGEPGVETTLPEPPYGRQVKMTFDYYSSEQSVLPAYHLCVAQALRDAQMQNLGVGGGFSAVEQIEILEAARGVAQQAAVQLARFAWILSQPESPGFEELTYDQVRNVGLAWSQTIPLLQARARDQREPFTAAALVTYGEDLAAAVQLHIAITEDLMRLYARNRSAGVPAQPQAPRSRAEGLWGAGSWYHRLLHLAYGGDPLYMPDGGPWEHPTRDWEEPGPLNTTYGSTFQYPGRVTFVPGAIPLAPTAEELPFVGQVVSDPGAFRLQRVLDEAGGVEYVATPSNRTVDVDASAELLFSKAEQFLRERQGLAPTPVPLNELDTYLWKTQRVTRNHARTLASLLADSLGYGLELGQATNYGNRGALNVRGDISAAGTGNDSVNILLSPGTMLVPRRLEQAAPYFSRSSLLRDGYEALNPLEASWVYGLPQPDSAVAEDVRLMGAMSALQLIRQKILEAHIFAQMATDHRNGRLNDILAHAPQILDVIDGAIGDIGITLHSPIDGTQGLVVTAPGDDPFWQADASCPLEVCYVDDADHSPSVFAEPESTIGGEDWSTGLGACEVWVELIPWGDPIGNRQVWHSQGSVALPSGNWSLVAWSSMADDLQLLASYVDSDTAGAQHLAYGGALGGFIGRQAIPLPGNPAEPGYDGFDMPSRWLPPASATLMGGEEGQSSVPFLLDLAKASAQDSANAVDEAMQHLLAVERDEISAASEASRAQQQLLEASSMFCGGDNPECDVETELVTVKPGWYPAIRNFPSAATIAACEALMEDYRAQAEAGQRPANATGDIIDCTLDRIVLGFLQQQALVAVPVREALDENTQAVPVFEEYKGGSVQRALIDQYAALKAPNEHFEVIYATADAAKQRAEAAEAMVDEASASMENKCKGVDTDRTLVAWDAAHEVWEGVKQGGPAGVYTGAITAIFATKRARRRMEEIKARCEEAEKALETTQQQELAQLRDSMLAVAESAEGMTAFQAAIAGSGATIEQQKNEVALASARIRLEQELALAGLQTSSGLYRQYHAYDVWRANALVENARRLAHAARRAIEARYVVDLSRMNASETFVASPALWANEIYEYDLSLPAAVGLETTTGGDNAIYGNKIVDYVRNLENFVAGYAVTRPSAAGVEDIDVINLTGLMQGDAAITEGGNRFYPEQGNWSVLCPATQIRDEQWLPVGVPGGVEYACVEWQVDCEVCLGNDEEEQLSCARQEGCLLQPLAARLSFSLDPWGQLNGSIVQEPYEQRYNARWSRLAVNFVGTGIRDCSQAEDPLSCYGEGFIRYDLAHAGPSYLTDYDGSWHLLQVPTAFVEAGKGLAAELWLDPLKDGWSTEYIAPVARTELAQRPLDGSYEITIDVTPEVRLERIERVQILQGSEYWVAQQY